MKRRELIRTAFSSIVATATLSAIPGRSSAADSNSVSLTRVSSESIPKTDVPIVSPNDVFTMPDSFWRTFRGKVYIGKAGEDPSKAGNLIDVFVKTSSGEVSKIEQPIALNKDTFDQFVSDKSSLISNNEYSMAVYTDAGDRLFYVPDVKNSGMLEFSRRLSQPTGYQLIGEITSFDELRNTPPLFEGAKVRLKSWHEGLEVGGGAFVGFLAEEQDDGGYIASAGRKFHWRRVIDDFNHMTLFDFGAIGDGKTDSAPAIVSMYNWAQARNQQISIQFPAGRFFVSKFDLTEKYNRFFRLAGSPVNFGYFPATTIISDGASDFVFSVNARWVEISNISFHGQNDKNKNKQGFFNNICPAGQFFRGACLRFAYVGGPSLSLMDTLDCKIDQWYATHCTGDVIKGTWSDTKKGAWDHNTAIELSNFNAQHCSEGMVLNLPRSGQSIIHNGWIEHTEYPGDITDGQWIIDAFSMEGCANPLYAQNSRLNKRQINLQGHSYIENSMRKGALLSQYELGSTQVESFGVAIDGSMKYGWLGSRYHLSNNTDQEQWIELGRMFSPEVGDSWEIEIFGQGDYDARFGGTQFSDLMGSNTAGGKALIQVQRKKQKSAVTWSAEGACPLVDVFYNAPYDTDTIVYIKLAKRVASATILIKSTANDRFMSGKCALFNASMGKVDHPPARASAAPRRLSLHNGIAGFGANEDGDIMMATRLLKAEEVETQQPQGFLSIVIDGEQCAVPYFKLRK